MKVRYPKLYNMAHLLALYFTASKGSNNYFYFHKTVYSSAATTLGHPSRTHQDWFDENDDEIQRLLEEKHRLHKAHQDDTSSVSKKGTSRQRSGKGAISKRFPLQKKVQVGKDQEKAQSEKDSHSKNPRWEKTKLTIRHLYHENIS